MICNGAVWVYVCVCEWGVRMGVGYVRNVCVRMGVGSVRDGECVCVCVCVEGI